MPTRLLHIFDIKGDLVRTEETEISQEQARWEQLEQNLRQALVDNRAFVAQPNPNAAALTAQVRALTRQQNKMIRLVLQLFDGTD